MRSVNELKQEELEQLRDAYFDQLLSLDDDVLGDITEASQIPMWNVKTHYEGMYFTEDDFFCNI